jgi:four helix bundle suffix protein
MDENDERDGSDKGDGRVDEVFGNRPKRRARTPNSIPQDSHQSHSSHRSHSTESNEPLLVRHRDYRTLISYQKSAVVYDITFRFCQRFLTRGDRTIDQMVQAARSGKQNIVEGSKIAATSRESEIRLTNVARGSLEELLEDYYDFLRVRDFCVWEKDSKEAKYVRKLGAASLMTFELFREIVESRSAEVVANVAICLIHQTNYLLDRQIKKQESVFLEDGGLRERMTRKRSQARDRNARPEEENGR